MQKCGSKRITSISFQIHQLMKEATSSHFKMLLFVNFISCTIAQQNSRHSYHHHLWCLFNCASVVSDQIRVKRPVNGTEFLETVTQPRTLDILINAYGTCSYINLATIVQAGTLMDFQQLGTLRLLHSSHPPSRMLWEGLFLVAWSSNKLWKKN